MNVVVGFDTTSEAILTEEFFKEKDLKGELIPIPDELGAGCGLCYKFFTDNEEEIRKIMEENELSFSIIKVMEV
ncbi:DUF3343 domain-containing protein [Anaerococcus sp. AGMB00486]|nr:MULTISPECIES: DUF3343 domain-containing protein [Anaerococcus]NVF11612.1 DUF3343 domain-containing protein [Anaerococcus faecalis]